MILEKKSLQYILMVVAASAVFMDYLDTSIVSIALPSITADLGVGSAVSAWVMTGYLLALASMLLVFYARLLQYLYHTYSLIYSN